MLGLFAQVLVAFRVVAAICFYGPVQVIGEMRTDESNNPHPVTRTEPAVGSKTPRIWFGYLRTVGIDRYRTNERYAAWIHTHKQLKKSVRSYAAACNLFYAQLACCLLLGFVLHRAMTPESNPVLAATVAFTGFCAATLLVLLREQRRRNVQIGQRFIGNG